MAQVRSNTAFGDMIVEAMQEAGLNTDDLTATPTKPKRKQRTVTRSSTNRRKSSGGAAKPARPTTKQVVRKGIGWEHPIAELTVSVDKANCGDIESDGPYTCAKLLFDRHPERGYIFRPKSLNVRMACQSADEDLLVFSVQSGTNIRRIDRSELPSLFIPVEWKDGGPQTRKAHEDNCGIILMDRFGRFIQLEVGVTVRSQRNPKTGKFKWAIYLNLQETFTGQVVRTTAACAEAMGLSSVDLGNGTVATVIPLWGYHAYPGNNWLGMNPAKEFGVKTVVPTAIAEDRSVQLSEASFEEWSPAELGEPSGKDRVRGTVLWYNCAWLGGAGFVQLEDGSNIFLHWSQLRGGLYAPQPMSTVEFFVGQHNGRPQAKAVRAV